MKQKGEIVRDDDLIQVAAHQNRPLNRSERRLIIVGIGAFILGVLAQSLVHWAVVR